MNADVTIPAFVLRGLNTMSGTDLESATYRTEADLRDIMAAAWWLHGAEVQTEVKVPDCGRIDILVRVLDTSLIIEVKKTIETATQARQAFQQAHSYLSYLQAEAMADYVTRRRIYACVTAPGLVYTATTKAAAAYSPIDDCSFLHLIAMARDGRFFYFEKPVPERVAEMQRVARMRLAAIQQLHGTSHTACAQITYACESPALEALTA